MEIDFLLTYDDYAAAQRTHRRHWFRWVVPALIVLTVFGVLWAATREVQQSSAYVLPLWSFIILLSLSSTGAWKRHFKKAFPTPPNIQYSFQEDSIRINSEVAQANLHWPSLQFVREGKDIFLLYAQPRIFHMVPKRVLSPEQVQELRELLKRKLPEK